MNNLTRKLSQIVKQLKGEARLTEKNTDEILREIRKALLEADVSILVIKELINRIKSKSLGLKVIESLNPGQTMVGIVYKELSDIMGMNSDLENYSNEISIAVKPPAVILMVGLQGSGKTTTAAKLACWFSKNRHSHHGKTTGKKKILLASTDIYRPAAIEQLNILAKQIDIDFFQSSNKNSPEEIAEYAVNYAKKYYYDILIIDTAGRIGIDELMMKEISNIYKITNPVETLLVIDSMQGQDAIVSAKNFSNYLSITGIILTKTDGDSRGGSSLSAQYVIRQPIKLIGTSEKLDGLEKFHPDRMAKRMLGMGDIISLFEEAQSRLEIDQTQKFASKFKSGSKFDLEDFKDYISKAKNFGDLNMIIDKLPMNIRNILPISSEDMHSKGILSKFEAIICSMTKYERRNPDIIKSSRKKRIAKGSGVQIQDVNRLISQFNNMQNIMKKIRKDGFAKILKNLGLPYLQDIKNIFK